jgi:vacuolar protein 8
VLVSLARDGSAGGKAMAAGALWNLAFNNDDNQVAIAAAGGIPVLVSLVRDGEGKGKEYAAGALANLATNDDNKVAITATWHS